MQANLGLHHGEKSCNIMALTCAIYTHDIRSPAQVRGARENCQNSAAFTVMVTTKIGQNCFHIHKNGLTTQSPVGLDILLSS